MPIATQCVSHTQLRPDLQPNQLVKLCKTKPNTLLWAIDDQNKLLTNVILFNKRTYEPQSGGKTKAYVSVIQPSIISNDLQSLHLIPRCITGQSGQGFNIMASGVANESMHEVERNFRELITKGDVLYETQAMVTDDGFLEIAQRLIDLQGRVLRRAKILDKSRQYGFVHPSWRGQIPTSKKFISMGSTRGGVKTINPFWDCPGREIVKQRIEEQKIKTFFPLASLSALPTQAAPKKITSDPILDMSPLPDLFYEVKLSGKKKKPKATLNTFPNLSMPDFGITSIPIPQLNSPVTTFSEANADHAPVTELVESENSSLDPDIDISTPPQTNPVKPPATLADQDRPPESIQDGLTHSEVTVGLDLEMLELIIGKIENRTIEPHEQLIVRASIKRLLDLI